MGESFAYGVLDPSRAAEDLGFRADPDLARGIAAFAAAL
jgi:nucleoside-diphosphate-sugar epimerase